jgi:hypothetical protein
MYEKLCEVLSICCKINRQTKANCFFDFSGHCDTYTVICIEDGWRADLTNAEWSECYIDTYSKVTEENLACTKIKLLEIAERLGVEL